MLSSQQHLVFILTGLLISDSEDMDKKRVESDLPGIYMSFIRSGLMLTFLLLDPWCREVLRMFDMTKRAENCIIRLVNIRDIFMFLPMSPYYVLDLSKINIPHSILPAL